MVMISETQVQLQQRRRVVGEKNVNDNAGNLFGSASYEGKI
jgi:hypothetical protein